MKNFIDSWMYEKDEVLRLAKLTLTVFILMAGVITMPVWIIPYLLYKKANQHEIR